MLFNSLTFIVFFIAVVALHYSVSSWRLQKSILLIASYIFYAAWNPPFVVLLWISTLVDWHVAKALDSEERPKQRNMLLAVSLTANLGLLAYFKYGGFLLDNFIALVQLAGFQYTPAKLDIILPVGISFYTFQTLSYTLDVYSRKAKRCHSFLDYALYVTFFPQLVAGPIVRAVDFLPQCIEPKRATGDQFGWGLYFMTLGLFQKTVLADGLLSSSVDKVFAFKGDAVFILDAWLGLLAFSAQIFFDFSGYSTCAIGAALCLGFVLPDNFRSPYFSIGFSDFWRRWHITLSSWLRDYLYIPLGGNRSGRRRALLNLMITMFLGGLWHGASWTFITWGVLHGSYLVAEHMLRQNYQEVKWTHTTAGRFVLAGITFFLVNIAWVFFRAGDFPAAWMMLASLFDLTGNGDLLLTTLEMTQVIVIVSSLMVSHWYLHEKRLEHVVQDMAPWRVTALWTSMVVGLIIMQGGANAFIYFQF